MGKSVSSLNIQTHDFIKHFLKTNAHIFDVTERLYSQGHSLFDVSRMTGYPVSTIRKVLKAKGVAMRPNKCVPAKDLLRQSFKSSTQPPYGFCYLDGKLTKDPKEYPVMRIIYQQWQQGASNKAIARYLDVKKIKSRSQKTWQHTSIRKIINRFKDGSVSIGGD